MAVTYTWIIDELEVFPTGSDIQTPINTELDVVHTVRYSLVCSDGEEEMSQKYIHSDTITMNTDNVSSFASFDSLDSDTVLGWVTESINNNSPFEDPINYLKSCVSKSLADIVNPPTVVKKLN